MMQARMLRPDDASSVVMLAKEHHATSRYAHIPFEEENVYKIVRACAVWQNAYGCAVLVDGSDIPCGYAAVVIEPYMWADVKLARDLAVYVTPPARSYPAFTALMQRIEAWCREKGVHTLDFGITSPRDDDEARRYGKVYERIGYVWHGEHYRKELV